MGAKIIDLYKKHLSKELFLKISHLPLRDLKGAIEVYDQVNLSPEEMEQLSDASFKIDREKKEERYYSSHNH